MCVCVYHGILWFGLCFSFGGWDVNAEQGSKGLRKERRIYHFFLFPQLQRLNVDRINNCRRHLFSPLKSGCVRSDKASWTVSCENSRIHFGLFCLCSLNNTDNLFLLLFFEESGHCLFCRPMAMTLKLKIRLFTIFIPLSNTACLLKNMCIFHLLGHVCVFLYEYYVCFKCLYWCK